MDDHMTQVPLPNLESTIDLPALAVTVEIPKIGDAYVLINTTEVVNVVPEDWGLPEAELFLQLGPIVAEGASQP